MSLFYPWVYRQGNDEKSEKGQKAVKKSEKDVKKASFLALFTLLRIPLDRQNGWIQEN